MFSKRPKGATIQEEKKSGIGGLLWMLFGAIVTIAVGVVAYKSPMFGFNDSTTDIQVIESEEPTVKPKVKTDTDNDYQFYDILPEQKMKPIPEDASIPQKVEEDIENKTKQFKPDTVVTETAKDKPTELQSSDKAKSNPTDNQNNSKTSDSDTVAGDKANSASEDNATTQTKPKQVTGDNEMVIVYENSTYDGTPVKKTTTVQPKKQEPTKTTTQAKSTKDNAKAETSQANETTAVTDKAQAKALETKSTKQSGVKPGTEVATDTEKAFVSAKDGKATVSTSTAQAREIQNKPKAVIEYAQPSTQPSKSYVLQINSYDTAQEADKRRAQVLMAGVDARVVRRSNGGETVYQVVSGSMTTAEAVVRAQQALQKNGINSLIVEKRFK